MINHLLGAMCGDDSEQGLAMTSLLRQWHLEFACGVIPGLRLSSPPIVSGLVRVPYISATDDEISQGTGKFHSQLVEVISATKFAMIHEVSPSISYLVHMIEFTQETTRVLDLELSLNLLCSLPE